MIRQIRPAEVKSLLDAGTPVVLIDCREPEEYAICKLDGSVLIPLGELQRRADEVTAPPGAAVVVYCHHGVRSLSGAMILMNAGLENVASMHGGIDAWTRTVDPTVRRY